MNSLGEDVYATLLLNDLYLPGALVLAHSLRDAGTTKKLAVFFTPESVSVDALKDLRKLFDYVIPTERINNEFPANLRLMNRPELSSTFTKIILWKQLQFRRIVYVDSDIVALRAPDELFDLPHSFSAASDIGWPDIFNSGLMVLTPNMSDYNALLSMAREGISFDGADQGLLNMHFRDNFNRLSFTYNVTPSAYYQYVPAYRHFKSKIVMAHFIGQNKPWMQGRVPENGSSPFDDFLKTWWRIYERHYGTPPKNDGDSKVKAEASTNDLEHPERKLDVDLGTISNRELSSNGKSDTEPYVFCIDRYKPVEEPNSEPNLTLNEQTQQRESSNFQSYVSQTEQYHPMKEPNSEQDVTLNRQAWQRKNSDTKPYTVCGDQYQSIEEQNNASPCTPNDYRISQRNAEELSNLTLEHNKYAEHEPEIINISTTAPESNISGQNYAENIPDVITNNKFLASNTQSIDQEYANHTAEEIGNDTSKTTKSLNNKIIDANIMQTEYENPIENRNLSQNSSEIAGKVSNPHHFTRPLETPVLQTEKYNIWDARKEPPPIDSKPEASNLPTIQYDMSSDPRFFKAPDKYPDPPKDMWFEVPKAPNCQKLAPIFPWEINAPKPTRIFADDTEDSDRYPSNLSQTKSSKQNSYSKGKATAYQDSTNNNEWQSFSLTNAWDHVPEIENYIGKLQKNTGRNNLVESPAYLKRSRFRGQERVVGQLPAAEGVPSREEWVLFSVLQREIVFLLCVLGSDHTARSTKLSAITDIGTKIRER
ncbi:hypothetical protein GcM3_013018 [Golovinomyces cichoracearum]|uniref:glycogenin glucosyltransferase n=1 Tax=Golovinomyces cichoracearum TaxID=62708 RepID=A0A420J9H6_9PEZI|nr:hypothetical protein GcM3_013018 [Golovinomyces cichoracearum]